MNLPNILLTLVIVVLSWAAGYLDGTEEADKINRGKPINHAWELTQRILWMVIYMVIAYLWNDWQGTTQWTLVGYAGLAFGVFVPTHRYFVNTRRTKPKRPWWWMGIPIGYDRGKASNYDTAWHWIGWKLSGGGKSRRYVEEKPKPFYSLKRPAQLAYAFELLVALSSLVLLTLTMWA